MHEARIPGWRALVRELIPFYKKNVWYLVGLSVVMGLLAFVPLVLVLIVYAVSMFAISSSGADPGVTGTLVNVVMGLLGIASLLWLVFASGAWQIAFVRASFDGATVPMTKLIRGSMDVNRAARVVGATIVYGILVLLGFVLFILPGVYIAIRGSYLSYALVHEDLGISDSFKRSWALTKGFWWVTALRFAWVGVVAAAGSAVIAIVSVAPAGNALAGLLDMAWRMLVVTPFTMVFSRRMYELVRDAKAKDAEAFHPLSSGEKWQVAGVIMLFLVLGSFQSSVAPKQEVGEEEFQDLFQDLDLE